MTAPDTLDDMKQCVMNSLDIAFQKAMTGNPELSHLPNSQINFINVTASLLCKGTGSIEMGPHLNTFFDEMGFDSGEIDNGTVLN